MNEKRQDKYFIYFRGARLNKKEAKQTGFSIIFGFIGIVLAFFIFGVENKIWSLLLISFFVGIGFFGYGHIIKFVNSKKILFNMILCLSVNNIGTYQVVLCLIGCKHNSFNY